MSASCATDHAGGRELSVSRLIHAPPAIVWRAWADHLADWWCPRPWRCRVDAMELRPGGRSAVTMFGPDGEESSHEGVYLEVVPERRIVFTDAFLAGWVPQGPFMVGIIDFAPEGKGTRYTARARHWSEETLRRHEAMGFYEGWGKVAEQLDEVARRLARGSGEGA